MLVKDNQNTTNFIQGGENMQLKIAKNIKECKTKDNNTPLLPDITGITYLSDGRTRTVLFGYLLHIKNH